MLLTHIGDYRGSTPFLPPSLQPSLQGDDLVFSNKRRRRRRRREGRGVLILVGLGGIF